MDAKTLDIEWPGSLVGYLKATSRLYEDSKTRRRYPAFEADQCG